jgi:flagellar biosynthesis chaperone FliJ
MQFSRSNQLNRRETNLSQSIVAVAILALVQVSCAQSSGAPPAPTVSKQESAATADSADKKDSSGLAGILGGGDKTESDYDVRARQLKQLADQRASYENQMLQYQSYRTTLVQTQAGIEDSGITSAAKGSLNASLAGGAVSILGNLAAGGLTGSATPSPGSNGAPTGGGGSAAGLGSAFGSVGTGITNGIAADDYNKQLTAGTKVVAGSVQSQRDQYDAIIANLQAKIAAINAQIDTLNAQKLKQ